MPSIPDQIPKTSLLSILKEKPEGWKVHELLWELEHRGFRLMDPGSGSIKVYRKNFWLLHQLHTLRLELHAKGAGEMTITTMEIRFLPGEQENNTSDGSQQPLTLDGLSKDHSREIMDPMDSYYLDERRFWETSEEEVEELLEAFWKLLGRQEARPRILEMLGLEEGADAHLIQKEFRKTIKTLHPDQGGDSQGFQELWELWTAYRID